MTKPLRSYEDVKRPPKPAARKRIKAVNEKRGGHRFPHNVNEPLREFVRGLPCILAGRYDVHGLPHLCTGVTEVCHLKTRGSGAPDDDNVWPGCRSAHWNQEGWTKEFEYRWQLRLKPICRKVTATFYGKAKHGGGGVKAKQGETET